MNEEFFEELIQEAEACFGDTARALAAAAGYMDAHANFKAHNPLLYRQLRAQARIVSEMKKELSDRVEAL